jgi:two-component system LytT family response regulator
MMPSIRTVIADDERLACKKLRVFLGSEPGVDVVAECRSGQETVTAVQTHKPDLLFLDIQMPDLDGFQVLSEIPPETMPVVIFTTAYDQYAIKAFESDALDYLLKPFDQKRLQHAIGRARAELLKSYDYHVTSRIVSLLAESKPAAVNERLVIRAGGRVVFLELDEIEWIEAAANYVKLNAGKDSYRLREGIGRISERLDPDRFVRIHRSIIVNANKIKELQPCNSGEYIAVLKNGKELSCGRAYSAQLQRLMGKHV